MTWLDISTKCIDIWHYQDYPLISSQPIGLLRHKILISQNCSFSIPWILYFTFMITVHSSLKGYYLSKSHNIFYITIFILHLLREIQMKCTYLKSRLHVTLELELMFEITTVITNGKSTQSRRVRHTRNPKPVIPKFFHCVLSQQDMGRWLLGEFMTKLKNRIHVNFPRQKLISTII